MKIENILKLIEKYFNINEYKVYALKDITEKKPIIAMGNDSVDIALLEYTKESKYESLRAMVIHDDVDSEINVDLDDAEKITKISAENNYDTISVKEDFKQLFPDCESITD